jgi:hypothetical protein
MLDKLCLVMDIDETMVHYAEEYTMEPKHFEFDTGLFGSSNDDILIHRPKLAEFFNYVNTYSPDNVFKSVSSQSSSPEHTPVPVPTSNKSIVIGIWTYGTRKYAKKVVELLKARYNVNFEFVYSREDMQQGMKDKELEFVLERHGQELQIAKENIYLVDNCPSNIYHSKNIKNGILVTSFIGHHIDKTDKMFEQLIKVCENLLHKDKVSDTYINKFTLNGVPTDIISIGKNGNKSWDSDDSCVLYDESDDAIFFNGGSEATSNAISNTISEATSVSGTTSDSIGGAKRKTIKRHKRYTKKRNCVSRLGASAKRNNKRRIYKTGKRL